MIPGLKLDLAADTPVYRQIAEAIRRAVAEGRLSRGRRLPPTRDLATELGVNRNTVVAAYDLLVEQGVVRSHTGRGTFLTSAPRADGLAAPADAWFNAFSRAAEGPGLGGLLSLYRVAISSEGISFAGSYPASDLLPVDAFRCSLDAVLRDRGADVLGYGPPAGYPPLREAIAAGMRRRGSRVAADEILVTNGSQQAIELVFRALVDRDDAVVLEDPTYTGALSVLGSLGARLVGVPSDENGMRPDLLARALERHRPRAIYLQPAFHNPTTRVMTEGRRREVLDVAARYFCAVVEDDWAGDLRFEGADVPSMHAMDGERHVIYVSTFSKKLLPGLRLGWVTAPAAVLQRLTLLKQIEDHGTSLLVQGALHEFLQNGGLDEHLTRVRSAYRDRRDAMLAALESSLPADVRRSKPEGGLFLWLTFPRGLDGGEIAAAARERGVIVSPGEVFHLDGGGRNTMRLTFSAASREQIESGIAVLAEVIRERLPEAGRTEQDASLEAVPIL